MNNEKKDVHVDPGGTSLSVINRISLPDMVCHLLFWPIFVVGLSLDLWTKKAVFQWLPHHRGEVPIIDGFLTLVLAVNNGAAFGIAAGHRTFLIAASCIALVIIFVIFFFSGTKNKIVFVAMGFFTAGVCGNLYDRIFNDGLVRDFIDVVYWPGKHWPAFNVADSMLCIGAGLRIISSVISEKSCQKHAPQHR